MKNVLIVKISAILLVLSCAAIPFSASAQSWGPRTLPQLKAEAQRRADGALSPVEIVRFPFEGKQAVAYLRLPKDVRPAPLIFAISGLDTRKEDMVVTNDLFLKNGIGIFAIDQPGTGQSPLKIDVGSERVFSAALDFLQTRNDVDAKRIVVRGQSWAGYQWFERYAATH